MKYTVVLEGVGHSGIASRTEERAQKINLDRYNGEGKIVEIETRKDLDTLEGGVVAEPFKKKAKGKRPAQTQKQAPASLFSVTQRFEMMNTITDMVARGAHKSAFVAGNGGTGKTMTVLRAIEESGMQRVELNGLDPDSPLDIEDDPNTYIKVSGATSPVGLYRLLYENNRKLIVLDDADGFLKNENAVNILKAVLDTTGDGTVSWRSPYIDSAGLPEEFTFKGRVVFISNKMFNEIPQAIASRALIVDMSLNNKEIIERARMLGEDLLPRLNTEQREELLDFVEQNVNNFKDVSLRTFVLAEPYVAEGLENWKDLVLFTA